MSLSEILIGALVSLVALGAISYIVEMLRLAARRPEKLAWAPGIPIQYVDNGGVRVRYISTGAGANLVLLHTLRTQLDVFAKIIPELANRFTVYAYDYPGHGWSDIPKAAYSPDDFYKWTAALLEKLDVRQAAVAGISIGGTISLVLAARQSPRVTKVYLATLFMRVYFIACIVGFYAMTGDPLFLVLVGVIGFGLALTLGAYLLDRKTPVKVDP